MLDEDKLEKKSSEVLGVLLELGYECMILAMPMGRGIYSVKCSCHRNPGKKLASIPDSRMNTIAKIFVLSV